MTNRAGALVLLCLCGCVCSRSTGGGAGGTGGTGGAGIKPLGCIEDWPAAGADTLDPPLDVTPEILWRIPLSRTEIVGSYGRIVATADAVAVSSKGPYWLDIVRLQDRAHVTFRAASGIPTSSVVVADEKRGRFIVSDMFATYSVGVDGKQVWEHGFGQSLSPQERNGGTDAIIDGEGSIYVAGPDGFLYKLDGETGTERWKVNIGLCGSQKVACELKFGAGNALFVDSAVAPVLGRDTGDLLGGLVDPDGSGKALGGLRAGRESGLVTGRGDVSSDRTEIVVMDRCGRTRWRLQGTHYAVPSILPHHDDLIINKQLVLRSGSTPDRMGLERYSKDGAKLASAEFTGIANRISTGSDGTLYVLLCGTLPPGTTDEGLELLALDPDLIEKWRIPFPNSACTSSSLGTLGPDGIYYLARWNVSAGPLAGEAELIAIRTQSPTTAKTSWPDSFGTSAGARWVLPAP